MKEAADSEKFRTFAHAHRKMGYDRMLARVRRRRGDPNWTPTGMLSGGGLWFAAALHSFCSSVRSDDRPMKFGG